VAKDQPSKSPGVTMFTVILYNKGIYPITLFQRQLISPTITKTLS